MTLTQGRAQCTGANGNEETGPGLPTTAVSIVHSEHPSRGANLVRNHPETRYSTLGIPPFCFGSIFLTKKCWVPQEQL